ncbi:DUF3793 family protein [uncultured Clostridium sp.]|uniref:DUF3793 family protein n=1 Tax=uncultured Clostridium sp. TaxID=59620 RepID=UPI0025D086ED|nr:DUF3793 family protein [uncultured Clostridium sp.]
MKYLDFYNRLNSMENEEYIENFLVYNSSWVIAGIKPAVTIGLKKKDLKMYKNWNIYGKKFLRDINLKYIELRENDNSIILMIYDEEVLKRELSKENVRNFLIGLGYPRKIEINQYVNTLQERYEKYHCPHELGLFLGIPFEDVKDFMECTTKKCLLCGYWKVYNNSEEAKNIFNQYDKIKNYTIKNMLDGNSSRIIVSSIKDSFYNVVCI